MTARRSGRVVNCPACGQAAIFSAENPFRPFCSARCRTADLGQWASESYRIPVKEDDAGGGPGRIPPE